MRYFRKYDKATSEYEGEVCVMEAPPTFFDRDSFYLYVEFTPPPMPEPEVTDGVYWAEDEDGDSGILCRHKGNWTDSDFCSRSKPHRIIDKLSK